MINTISESTSSDIQTNTGPKTALWSLGVTQRILCACLARQHHSHVLVLEDKEEPKTLTAESNKSQREVSSPSLSKRVPVYPLGIHYKPLDKCKSLKGLYIPPRDRIHLV